MFARYPHSSVFVLKPSHIWIRKTEFSCCRFCGLSMQLKKIVRELFGQSVRRQSPPLRWSEAVIFLLFWILLPRCHGRFKIFHSDFWPDVTGSQATEPSESDTVRGMFCPNPKREHQSKHEWRHGGQIWERWEERWKEQFKRKKSVAMRPVTGRWRNTYKDR